MPALGQHGEHGVEVLATVGTDQRGTTNRGGEQAARHAVDPDHGFQDRGVERVGLVPLSTECCDLGFETRHPTVAVSPDHEVVSFGRGHGECRACRPAGAVSVDQEPKMRRLDEWEIGRDHEEVVVVEEFVEATESDECGVGAAAVVALLDEGDVDRGRVIGHPGTDPITTWTGDHDRRGDPDVGERVEHVPHHRLAAEDMDRLRAFGADRAAAAGGDHECRQAPLREPETLADLVTHVDLFSRRSRGRIRTYNGWIQSPVFYQLNYPGKSAYRTSASPYRNCHLRPTPSARRNVEFGEIEARACVSLPGRSATIRQLMGSLIKKRRKRMRKKKHRKLLKRTRVQRRNKK